MAASVRPAGSTETTTVSIEVVSWITKFIGGDGTGRRVLQEPYRDGATVKSVLRSLTSRYPDLDAALWEGGQLGAHIEVLVNDSVLGVTHELDSPVKPGDQISLLGQYMGG
jgi:molybdopterin converting factor small subunit